MELKTILEIVGGVLFAFFAPIVPLILLVGMFVLIDTIFGVMSAKHQGKEITSNKFSRILYKTIAYFSLILMAYGLDFLIINEIMKMYLPINLLFTKLITAIIGVVEWYSIDEKIRKMNNGKGLKYYTLSLISNLKSVTGKLKDVKENVDDLTDIGEDKEEDTE